MCNKFKKVFISFIIVLSFAFSSFFVSASPAVYNCYYQRPQLNGKNFYLEFVTSNGWPLLFVGEASAIGSGSSMSINFTAEIIQNTLYVYPSEQYLDSNGVNTLIRCVGYLVDLRGNTFSNLPWGTTPSGVRSALYVALGNMGNITFVHAYNCNLINFSNGNGDFVFNYGSDTVLNDKLSVIVSWLSTLHSDEIANGQKLQQVINQIMTSNASLNQIKSTLDSVLTQSITLNSKLDKILALLDEAGGGSYAPSQEDKDTINNTEKQQDDLLTDNDPSSEISAINNNVLSFVQSAPNTLSFAKSIFERLVTGNIAVLVFASISLAVFPLLLGFFKGGRR